MKPIRDRHDQPVIPKRVRSPASDRQKLVALIAMCLALFTAVLDDTVVNVALPQIQLGLDASVSRLQWILNAYSLTLACLVLPCGTLGDIYGRKRVFLTGLMLFTLASVLSGLAFNLPILIAGRILQGIGAAALIPTSLAIVVDTFPDPQEQAKAISFWTAVSGLALLAGPLLGGILVDIWGWQSVFLINLPLGMLTFWIAFRFVELRTQPTARQLDVPGIVLSIVLLASLSIAFTEENSWTLWFFGVACLSLISLVIVESRSVYPLLPLRLFRNATFSAVCIVNIMMYFTMVGTLFIFSLFLQQIQGYSAAAAGIRYLPLNSAFIFASFISGWLASKLGLRFTIVVGLILAGAATLSFVHINSDTAYSIVVWKLVLSGFGGGLTLPSLAAAAMGATPAIYAGTTAAILNVTARLGGALGIALQGTIVTQRLASNLRQRLFEWDLSVHLHDQIVADALHNVATPPRNPPASIDAGSIHRAMQGAFVSGLHTAFAVGGLVLLAGASLMLATHFIVQPSRQSQQTK